MTNNFDAHNASNRARDIRGAYMAQSLSSMVKATISSLDVKSALSALAATAPLAGHRI